MKLFTTILLLLGSAYSSDFKNVKVLSIYDGDTLKVQLNNVDPIFGENISIRVKSIDAPEIRTKNKCEKTKAKEALSIVQGRLKLATQVNLKNCTRGKYFRLVCDVYFDNKSIAQELIQKNLAYQYDGGKKRDINWCNFRGISSGGGK